MSLNIGDNFSYQGKKFLDDRQSFETLEELRACRTVPQGFIAYCQEDSKRYEFINNEWIEYKEKSVDRIMATESLPDDTIEDNIVIWLDMSNDSSYDSLARINDDAVSSSTTWSSEKIKDILSSQTASAKEVQVSDEVPTEEEVYLWVNTSEETGTGSAIARINDDAISLNTTWSSKEINSRFNMLAETLDNLIILLTPVITQILPPLVEDDNYDSLVENVATFYEELIKLNLRTIDEIPEPYKSYISK